MPSPQTPNQRRALSVSELNHQVRHLLEVSFLQVYVEGELSSFSRPSSGHWYFTLKDAKAQVRCAMFRGRNQAVRTIPREGDQVLIRAKVSLYEGRGDYQLLVEDVEPAGLGALQRAFDALKQKLEAEGLFDPAHKRAIPAVPRHIGVVTSPTGAAIHDILTVLGRRFPSIPVTLFPTAVQGQTAARDIANAIALANAHSDCDVLIVGRGGGSLEDLWAFNEEAVARAIYDSRIPVISAVGHEVDFTIADFVADLRAPTPSAAAEKASPNRQDWLDSLSRIEERLYTIQLRQLRERRQRVEQLRDRLRDPRQQLQEKAQRLDDLEMRLQRGMTTLLQQEQRHLAQVELRLRSQSPTRHVRAGEDKVRYLQDHLERLIQRRLDRTSQRLEMAAQTLHVVSPLATLGRGYAIVSSDRQQVIRTAKEVAPGDRVRTRLGQGTLVSVVEKSIPETDDTPQILKDS